MPESAGKQIMVRKKNVVRDQQGAEYELKRKLGEGGQGVVCETQMPNVLAKLFTDRDEDRRRHWVNRLNWVLRQELDGLHIARPRALIERPYPGYVMELMEGLESLEVSLERSFEALVGGSGILGFVETGGLRRRLALLRELAAIIAGLHARGLAYGDLSPANIFVSQSVEHHEVWLIDCDNLCTTERRGYGHVYTPGYGASEVVRGESGVNSLTDAWSFAIIAFELLTHGHPFKGEAVLDAEQHQEERALRGELSWVHHPEDRSNQACDGLPLQLVATPRLQSLFEDCFNAGRDDPCARPSLATWVDALEAAWALTLTCTDAECSSSFFWNDSRQCPFCGRIVEDGLLLSHAWLSAETPDTPYLDTGDHVALGIGKSLPLHLAPVGTRDYREAPAVCELMLDADGLSMTPHSASQLRLIRLQDGKNFEFTTQKRLKSHQRQGMQLALVLSHSEMPNLRPVWQFTW
jgi:serine/threonine protein kinase